MSDKKIIMMFGLPQITPQLPKLSERQVPEEDEEKSFLVKMLQRQDMNHQELMEKLSQINLGMSRSGHAGGG